MLQSGNITFRYEPSGNPLCVQVVGGLEIRAFTTFDERELVPLNDVKRVLKKAIWESVYGELRPLVVSLYEVTRLEDGRRTRETLGELLSLLEFPK